MGFNIGVYSDHAKSNPECYQFIERTFYDFVNSGEQYGDESILIQSGQYYGLDLSPLLKLVYTWDEVSQDYGLVPLHEILPWPMARLQTFYKFLQVFCRYSCSLEHFTRHSPFKANFYNIRPFIRIFAIFAF